MYVLDVEKYCNKKGITISPHRFVTLVIFSFQPKRIEQRVTILILISKTLFQMQSMNLMHLFLLFEHNKMMVSIRNVCTSPFFVSLFHLRNM